MPVARFVLVAAACAIASVALAQNLGFLKGGPMEYMKPEDIQLLTKNYREALEKLPDGHTNAWLNSKTGHSGTATPQKSFQRSGRECRLLEFTNAAGGLTARSEFTFCKQPDGAWKSPN
ncbi:MAG: RT0821/Lpp0805 family surface protein [Gammaproteobacteria bacterium]